MILRLQACLIVLSFNIGHAHGRDEQTSDFQVLKGDQNQVLWNTLIAKSRHLDQVRAKQLSKALQSPKTIRQHLVSLNDRYRRIIGTFPDKTALNAQVTGRLDGMTYRVEKVLFESLPNHHVTALLYLPPKGNGPWPGVLFACGHSANGKAYPAYQTACALLAQNGFVVLSYDPVSQGERTQQPNAKRYGTTTHTLLNHGSRLVGRSVVWYSAWDGIRAIDYLLSRPEVNSSKPIGMTGTSGGGTQTTFLMALDDRIGPAAPSCYTMRRTDKFLGHSGPADGCQHLANEGLNGIDHIDYSLMRAPRPTNILAATQDFFEIDSTRETIRDAQSVFSLLRAPRRFSYYECKAEHGMHVEHRQEATRWMLQWLYNDPFTVIEPNYIQLFNDTELQVTKSGQVYKDFETEMDIAAINLQLAQKLKDQRDKFWETNEQKALAKVRKLIGLSKTPIRAKIHKVESIETKWAEVDKFILKQPDGMPVPAVLFRPLNHANKALDFVIITDSLGINNCMKSGIIRKLLNKQTALLTVDLRGFGETKDKGSNQKYQSHSHRTANVSTHIGRPLLGQRVADLLTVIDFIDSLDAKRNISLIGLNAAAPVALHAAALDKRISKLSLKESPINSWEKDLVAKPLRSNMADHVVPNALLWYDLPHLKRYFDSRIDR